MIVSYSVEEVAAQHLPAEWKDGVRWLKRRLASGEIPGKLISRGVWRMTDADIAAWLQTRDQPAAPLAPADDGGGMPASIVDGLSRRSRRRVQAVVA